MYDYQRQLLNKIVSNTDVLYEFRTKKLKQILGSPSTYNSNWHWWQGCNAEQVTNAKAIASDIIVISLLDSETLQVKYDIHYPKLMI